MAYCLINTIKSFAPLEIEQELQSIIHSKFADLLKIETHTAKNEMANWDIRFDSTHRFTVCLKTTSRLIFEYPDDLFSRWAQMVCEDVITHKYECVLVFDEESPKLKELPNIALTFKDYLDTALNHHSSIWKQALIAIELDHLPETLKAF